MGQHFRILLSIYVLYSNVTYIHLVSCLDMTTPPWCREKVMVYLLYHVLWKSNRFELFQHCIKPLRIYSYTAFTLTKL